MDDVLRRVLALALEEGELIIPRKGSALDLTGMTIELTNPLARLSRTVTRGILFSPLGELCWYLSGSKETANIAPYIPRYEELDEDGEVHGGYGPRLFGPGGSPGQLHAVIGALESHPTSRKAVVQIFDESDLASEHRDVPCTCLFHFLVRSGSLVMLTYMRSNDAFMGLPHDFFAFTMLQELVARSLGLPIGPYVHVVGSLHLYERDIDRARELLDEGWQTTLAAMPPMPDGDPWPMVRALLDADMALRSGVDPISVALPDDPYWADLVRVLMVFFLFKSRRADDALGVIASFNSDTYRLAATSKIDRLGAS